MNIQTLLAILFLYLQSSLAFHQLSPTLSLDQLALRPMSQLSASTDGGLTDQLSRYQQRDPISNDNVFFIELGFGKIKQWMCISVIFHSHIIVNKISLCHHRKRFSRPIVYQSRSTRLPKLHRIQFHSLNSTSNTRWWI